MAHVKVFSLQFLVLLNNQEHGLNVFVIAVHLPVCRLNYNFASCLPTECNATSMSPFEHPASTAESCIFDWSNSKIQLLEKVDFCYRLNDTKPLCGVVEVKDHKVHRSRIDLLIHVCKMLLKVTWGVGVKCINSSVDIECSMITI